MQVYACSLVCRTPDIDVSPDFSASIERYTRRIDAFLDASLPPGSLRPSRLHEAMRYAVFNGGKRLRPLLVYASGECLRVDPEKLDPLAASIEFIHAFSLVHDDLPAMDDDDLRRGKPTLHKAYDEATAILAADALQPLAFQVLAEAGALGCDERMELVSLVARACGSLGMTGGQSIDLASEGQRLSPVELEQMHALKTGALLRACVIGTSRLAAEVSDEKQHALSIFADCIGLAFQIRDDILDVEGETDVIGKPAGSDSERNKATWPSIFGLQESRDRCLALLDEGLSALAVFGAGASLLRALARYVVERRM